MGRRAEAPTEPVLSTERGRAAALAMGRRYVDERGFRRDALVDSLLEADNGYARLRLSKYGRLDEWEALPVLNLPKAALRVDSEGRLVADSRQSLDLSGFVWEHSAVVKVGRRAFEQWPIRRRTSLEQEFPLGESLAEGQLTAQGLWQDERGTVGGLVVVEYPGGSTGLSFSCASCHARPNATGRLEVGGDPVLRLGPMAAEDTAAWPSGSVDVTPDGVNNPVRIADLRTTRWQSRLHHTGNLENGLIALAVRIETLLITSVSEAARPPREVSFALAYYLWSLGEQAMAGKRGLVVEELPDTEGGRLFQRDCLSCHRSSTGAGDWVPVQRVNSDAAVADSATRGTGGYRVPSLLGFSERRLGHRGEAESLREWLLPVSGTGEGGHIRELLYTEREVDALEEYLREALFEPK